MTTSKRGTSAPAVMLSTLFKHAVIDAKGETVGQLADGIVELRGGDYPLLTGLVAQIGDSRVFVPIGRVVSIDTERIALRSAKLDLRPFARRPGEVLLREDVLGHRLIDVDRAVLVRAFDVQLSHTAAGWIATGLDVHKRGLLRLLGRHEHHPIRDWRSFEALIGHEESVLVRSPFGRLRRLKPAQLADLIEAASQAEQDELLAHVHTDPELEADVFEELDEDQQAHLLRSRPTAEIAEVISRMRADDAADAVMDLPQDRRLEVLDLLPDTHRVKVRTLLGYSDTTAGGLMGMDYLAVADTTTAQQALDSVREATTKQPEALSVIFTVDADNKLTGALSLVQALQSEPNAALQTITDHTPTHAHPTDDLVSVIRQMADFNLFVLPVVDEHETLLGVITVDDALEAAIPADWMRREPHRHHLTNPTEPPTPTG